MTDRSLHYTLDQHGTPVPCDLMTWARCFEGNGRQVGDTYLSGIRISTVFLGLDHSHSLDGPPVLWETMIFADEARNGRRLDQEQWRCPGNREQAEAMHAEAVALVAHRLADIDPVRDYVMAGVGSLIERFRWWQMCRQLRRHPVS